MSTNVLHGEHMSSSAMSRPDSDDSLSNQDRGNCKRPAEALKPSSPPELSHSPKKTWRINDDILRATNRPRELIGSPLCSEYSPSAQPTAWDAISLQKLLSRRLKERCAAETGICPIRRELYSQCFDELIRQASICTERSTLLLRVRDEMERTMTTYRTLYECSITYSKRKLQADHGKTDLIEKIADLEQEVKDLRKQVEQEKIRHDANIQNTIKELLYKNKMQKEKLQLYMSASKELEAHLKNIKPKAKPKQEGN